MIALLLPGTYLLCNSGKAVFFAVGSDNLRRIPVAQDRPCFYDAGYRVTIGYSLRQIHYFNGVAVTDRKLG